MSELLQERDAAPQDTSGAEPPAEAPQAPKRKKKKNRKVLKRVIAIVIILAIIGGIVVGLISLFSEEEVERIAMTEFSYRGSIQTMVTGSGVTQPASSETIVATQKGVVEDVLVSVGSYVNAGDLLYTVDKAEGKKAVDEKQKLADTAQESLSDINEEIADLYDSQAKLRITAPYGGKLLDVSVKVGDTVTKGTVVGRIVDDSKIRLTQYFSYAYEKEIRTGMSASISIPSVTRMLSATVESVTMIERVSVEGGKLFEVTLVADNPGTLTEGMAASGAVTSASGEEMHSYESGTLEYYSESEIKAEAAGTVLSMYMKDFLSVSSGAELVRLDTDEFDDQLKSLNKSLKSAQATYDTALENLEEAIEDLDGYSATAPISGTVMSCTIYAGVEIGTSSSITIADTEIMYISANVDEQSISNVSVGTYADIIQYSGVQNYYGGTVVEIGLEGSYEYGVSTFPVKIEVMNSDGGLMSGMYCEYSMMGNASDDCILVPNQAVKYTELGACVFVMGEGLEGALELGEDIVPTGFSAMSVVTGLSDSSVVEIISGIDEGAEVFTQWQTNNANSWGY